LSSALDLSRWKVGYVPLGESNRDNNRIDVFHFQTSEEAQKQLKVSLDFGSLFRNKSHTNSSIFYIVFKTFSKTLFFSIFVVLGLVLVIVSFYRFFVVFVVLIAFSFSCFLR